MARLFQTDRLQTAIWASKTLSVMVGIVSTVTLLKVAVIPYLLNLTLSTVPNLWISIRSCVLSPLYIYIVVNFIIITIAASSTFQRPNPNLKQFPSTAVKKQFQSQSDKIQNDSEKNHSQIDNQISWHNFPIIEEEDKQTRKPNSTEPPPNSRASPPDAVDTPFNDDSEPETNSSYNRLTDSGPGRPEEDNSADDTLEGTWKAIMEGQGKAKARQLKKSETWDVPPRVVVGARPGAESDPADWARRELKKSETFNERVTVRMRDESMSQEELYQRAEEFIKKFNHDMRLQRQESDQRFMEMVHRGL